MVAPRTFKVLTALLVAMTVGTLVLMVFETDPIRPTAQPLTVLAPPPAGAAQLVYDVGPALRVGRWRHVVVHSAPSADDRLARRCHFLVAVEPDGTARTLATPHWRRQDDGGHIGGFWRDSTVGVCLIGRFDTAGPDPASFDALVELVQALQRICRIPAERVYLERDLVSGSAGPGRAFPAAAWSRHLLRPER